MKVDQKIIDQIVELKSRQLKRTGRVDQVHKRLIPISDAYKLLASRDISNRQVRTELLRYIPVSLVACIEGYFTLAIKDIVDGGPPFSNNVNKFKDLTFKLESVLALHEKNVTLGDIVAGILPLSNPSAIYSCMETILGESFTEMVKHHELKCPHCDEKSPLHLMFPSFFKEIEQIYKVRNIFFHEIAPSESVSVKQIGKLLSSATLFIYVSESIITDAMLFMGQPDLTLNNVLKNVKRKTSLPFHR